MFSLPANRSASFGSNISTTQDQRSSLFVVAFVVGLARISLVVAVVFILSAFPKTAFAKSTCLLATTDSCALKTDFQGLRVQVDEREKVVVIFGNSKEEFVRAESYVNVQEDLMRLEASNDIEAGESKQIQNELVKYDGASYTIPDSTELLSALGFPETTSVTADDYIDLIKVHMQLVLSLSASAASYLSDLLGIESIDTVPAPVATATPTPVEPAAPVATPAIVPAPAAEPIVLPVTPALVPVPLPSPNVPAATAQPGAAPSAAPEVVPLPSPVATPEPVAQPTPISEPAPAATPMAVDPVTPNRN